MKAYKDYQPTGFDSKGAFLPDQQDWLVLPTGQNRDSGVLEKCNFEAALEQLGGESETVEVHRFNHWACGWFELILVDSNSKESDIAKQIEKSLKDYTILDEEKYSQMRWDSIQETWTNMSLGERINICKRFDICFLAARHDYVPENNGSLDCYLED